MLLDPASKSYLQPFRRLEGQGLIDLHHHSVHMARAAMRCAFNDMLSEYDAWLKQVKTSPERAHINSQPSDRRGLERGKGKDSHGERGWSRLPPVFLRMGKDSAYISVIVGQGDKLAQALTSQLQSEFNPPVKVHVHRHNRGRLIIPNSQILAWLRAHSSVYKHAQGRGSQHRNTRGRAPHQRAEAVSDLADNGDGSRGRSDRSRKKFVGGSRYKSFS